MKTTIYLAIPSFLLGWETAGGGNVMWLWVVWLAVAFLVAAEEVPPRRRRRSVTLITDRRDQARDHARRRWS